MRCCLDLEKPSNGEKKRSARVQTTKSGGSDTIIVQELLINGLLFHVITDRM